VKSSNRFLLGFGIAITALIAVVIVLVVVNKDYTKQYPADTPQGVVQQFIQSMKAEDYPQAFTFLNVVESGRTLTYQEWLTSDVGSPYRQSGQSSWRASFGKINTYGNTATVEVNVDVFQAGGPFGNPINSQTVLFNLTKIDGTWYITTRPSVWWMWY